MTVSPLILCNNILKRGTNDKKEITPMKLQKLMYFVCRDYLKKTNTDLISERFAVWQYGPVLISIYDEFKSFGSKPITGYAKTADGKSYMLDESADPHLSDALNSVWGKYKDYSGMTLSRITHWDGSGWNRAYQKGMLEISREDMLNDTADCG